MNDKELTELAAKAFGVAAEGFSPLSDDGDALRLAVKLKLEVGVWFETTRVESDEAESMVEKHGSDPYAATRRAIVRAAAEIQLQRERKHKNERIRATNPQRDSTWIQG